MLKTHTKGDLFEIRKLGERCLNNMTALHPNHYETILTPYWEQIAQTGDTLNLDPVSAMVHLYNRSHKIHEKVNFLAALQLFTLPK